MFGDFNTGPNAPRKRSRVAQGIHIGRRRSIPNAHSMRIFGCFGTAFGIRPKCRHADNAAMAKSIRRDPMCRAWAAPSIIPMAPQRCAQAVAQDRLGFIPQRGSGPHPGHPATWACVIPQRRARIVVDLFRSAKFDPRLDHPAALDLGRPVPDTTPKPLGGEPKTKNRLGLQLFCD